MLLLFLQKKFGIIWMDCFFFIFLKYAHSRIYFHQFAIFTKEWCCDEVITVSHWQKLITRTNGRLRFNSKKESGALKKVWKLGCLVMSPWYSCNGSHLKLLLHHRWGVRTTGVNFQKILAKKILNRLNLNDWIIQKSNLFIKKLHNIPYSSYYLWFFSSKPKRLPRKLLINFRG